ncbi:hypothetical protein CRM22_003675 [Opisthorchis felineus]|uniref:Uncharacterized protein n=1 Tax=Opisthorchis felineus TaxID=147828 RepID=A0A4S2M575_OPIFE|nr:hypothetical protein CRM22_003675 [Opisthorchis felineus]
MYSRLQSRGSHDHGSVRTILWRVSASSHSETSCLHATIGKLKIITTRWGTNLDLPCNKPAGQVIAEDYAGHSQHRSEQLGSRAIRMMNISMANQGRRATR